MINLKQLFCHHWWKCISKSINSPYFVYKNTKCFYVEQCKQCGKMRIAAAREPKEREG